MPCTVGVHPMTLPNQERVLCPNCAAQTRAIRVECDARRLSVPGNRRLLSHSTGGGELLGFLLAFELRSVELGVEPACGDELIVGAPLQHTAVIDDEDLVRLADGRQPV